MRTTIALLSLLAGSAWASPGSHFSGGSVSHLSAPQSNFGPQSSPAGQTVQQQIDGRDRSLKPGTVLSGTKDDGVVRVDSAGQNTRYLYLPSNGGWSNTIRYGNGGFFIRGRRDLRESRRFRPSPAGGSQSGAYLCPRTGQPIARPSAQPPSRTQPQRIGARGSIVSSGRRGRVVQRRTSISAPSRVSASAPTWRRNTPRVSGARGVTSRR